MHEKSKRRRTFVEHFSKGYVLVTAFENYRFWIMRMKDTRATRILDTIFYKYNYITDPGVTSEDIVIAVASKSVD